METWSFAILLTYGSIHLPDVFYTNQLTLKMNDKRSCSTQFVINHYPKDAREFLLQKEIREEVSKYAGCYFCTSLQLSLSKFQVSCLFWWFFTFSYQMLISWLEADTFHRKRLIPPILVVYYIYTLLVVPSRIWIVSNPAFYVHYWIKC